MVDASSPLPVGSLPVRGGASLLERCEPLSEIPRIVIFDFDRTLAVRHVGMFDVNGDVAGRCFGGPSRTGKLSKLLRELRAEGCTLWVVTRNSAHIVNKALTAVALRPLFAGIVGNETFGDEFDSASGLNKTAKSVAIRRHVLTAAQDTPLAIAHMVLFVDDDAAEVSEVSNALSCATIHAGATNAHGEGGMSGADMEAVRRWATAVPCT